MQPLILNDLMNLAERLLNGALAKWNEGLMPFLTSPYGIFLLFVIFFTFLNSMRMKL